MKIFIFRLTGISILLLLMAVLSGCRSVSYLLPFGYGSDSGEYTTNGDCATQPKKSDASSESPASEPEYCEPKYSFEPPRDYEGQECIRRLCHRQQDKCMEELRIKNENCQHYDAMARIEFSRCLSSGATNCFKSTHTCRTPDPTQCEEDFRRCYVSCGGEVINSCDKKNENGGAGGDVRL